MDTQELVETIKMWNEFYKDMQYNNNTPEELKKWKENMFKIISVINIPEAVLNTPAEKNLQIVVNLAKSKDENKLEEIYNLLKEVENYFKDVLV